MEAGSFVSRARTAIQSAAVKAEKAFTVNIKRSSDSVINQDIDDTQSRTSSSSTSPKYAPAHLEPSPEPNKKGRRPKPIKTKPDWHERFQTLRIGKKEADEEPQKLDNLPMTYAIFDDNLYLMGEKEFSQSKASEQGGTVDNSQTLSTDIIPSLAIVKRLAVLVEAGVHFNSVKDLLGSSRGSSPVRERASLSISAVKSLVLREKEDKLASEFGSDERVLFVIRTLLNPEGHFTGRTLSGLEAQTTATSLMKEIHGAPIDSFIVKLSEAVGCFKTMRKMASFWSRVVTELRRLWCEGQYIPGIPLDDIPDLNSCLLYQQFQVINCCISRKRRHEAAVEALDFVTSQANSNAEGSLAYETTTPNPSFYARTMSGELVLRLGADKKCDNLTMLETGESIYSPIMQEPPLLTEDLIKETEEFVLRTGSVGAGCSQLLSDMQAFKAANPGCILEDFIRWHSPPDWTENESNDVNDASDSGDVSLSKGQLSGRMQKAGNLWRELWEASKPVPAVRQAPLYDEDLAVEGILDSMEDISPTELFKQLFIVALGSGLVIAESILSTNPSLIKMFIDCKNYIVGTCQGDIWVDKLDDICQVYESIESMLLNQEEFLKNVVQPEESTSETTAGTTAETSAESPATGDQLSNRFKKLTLIFGGKGKTSPNASTKESKNTEESPGRQSFSLFKRPPKPSASPSSLEKPPGSVENDWTIV